MHHPIKNFETQLRFLRLNANIVVLLNSCVRVCYE